MTEDARDDAETLDPEAGEETFDFKLDRNNLFQEETFTDIRSGSVKRFTPIRPDGTPDKSRNTIYVGQTSLYTPDGPLPIQNVIAAKDLAQAFKRRRPPADPERHRRQGPRSGVQAVPGRHGAGRAAPRRRSQEDEGRETLAHHPDPGVPHHCPVNPRAQQRAREFNRFGIGR
ncbi:MAG: hypothetical protein MUE48_13360 [Desulfobacterales bacterium]|nr:hypothetical protein [Desulfobacterales bacterium]